MRARKFIDEMLSRYLTGLHARLAESLKVAVGSALNGGHLSLSQLARSVESATAMRHRIKRIDRLLGNTSLHGARLKIYRAVANDWLAGLDHLLVVIDWSDATADQRWHLLRASVAIEGRSVTLYEEIHPQRKYGNQSVHRQFLSRLAQVLPAGCVPIILTDAGFKSTWFDLVTAHRWQWIGRIRSRDMVSIAAGPWRHCSQVYADATSRIQTFSEARYVRSHPTACRLVLVRHPPKGRSRRTKRGAPSRARSSLKAARGAREPWLLACAPSLAQSASDTMIKLYAKRMRIEQSFRDIKNERLGLGLSATRSGSGQRLEILLLIGHLASWLMRLIGECAQQCQMQLHFQSVPGLKHKEISVLTLARRVIDAAPEWLRQLRPKGALKTIHEQAQQAVYGV